jgi:hypothetical protein
MKVKLYGASLLALVSTGANASTMDQLQQHVFSLSQGARKTVTFDVIKPANMDAFVMLGVNNAGIAGVNCDLSLKDPAGKSLGTFNCAGSFFQHFKMPTSSPSIIHATMDVYNANFSQAQSSITVQSIFRFGTTTDADGDGMPSWFETNWGFNDNNAADALLDKDGDGYSNLQEYLHNTDPTKVNSPVPPDGGTPPVYPPAVSSLKTVNLGQTKQFVLKGGSRQFSMNLSVPAATAPYTALVGLKPLNGGVRGLNSQMTCQMRVSYIEPGKTPVLLKTAACKDMGDLFTKTPEVPQNAALMVAISGYNSSAYNLTLSYGGQAVYGDISDKDLDGLPAWYEELHGLSDSLLTDADLDTDADGYSNLQEYNAGTDPKLNSSKPE